MTQISSRVAPGQSSMSRKDRRAKRGLGGGHPLAGRPPVPLADRMFAAGCEHHSAGRLAEAEHSFRKALELDPQHADAFNSLGVLAHQCGNHDAAIGLIGRAIALDGRIAQYHFNMGLVMAVLGRMDDAIVHNRRAIALAPDYADAHTNLAAALTAKGQVAEAALHFRRALSRLPSSPVAYVNLATALLAEGKADEALGVAARGLAVGESDALKNIFALCAAKLRSLPKIPAIATLAERALTEGWARPEEFAALFLALVRKNEAIAALMGRIDREPLAATAPLDPPEIAELAASRPLRCLMIAMPICDVALERVLTRARSALLKRATAPGPGDVPDDTLTFFGALAQQCFINEYVFHCGSAEEKRARALHNRLAAALAADASVPALTLVAVAAYFPLHGLGVSAGRFEPSGRPWPEAVTALLTQQVGEPAQEHALRPSIPALTPVTQGVSVRVRQQYEENPYPRWVAASSLDIRLTVDEHIASQFPGVAFAALNKSELDVLIAGCGTGRHAIETARWLAAGARVLAIDLSVAALAYAERKARERGVANLEFAQADILRLGDLGRTFDVIEAVGVLHHLGDPPEGWRLLIGLLRPGGLMRVGLYSASARRHVDAARAFIAERDDQPTPAGIRECRVEILGLPDGNPVKKVSESADFFTVSRCRDLLFHVEEHPTTIPAIASFLAANHLRFLGFEGEPRTRYAALHPEDTAMTDLESWHAFEVSHPSAFERMYQFWLQKPA
jgi:tetratricopeptide (TPR) repeat protein/SAM-dependent methyltransferase